MAFKKLNETKQTVGYNDLCMITYVLVHCEKINHNRGEGGGGRVKMMHQVRIWSEIYILHITARWSENY